MSKGSLSAWLLFIIISVVIIIGYSVFSRLYAPLFPLVNQSIPANESSSSEAFSVIDLVTNVWQYWVLAFLLFALVWVFATSQKEEPYYYGG